VNRAVSSLSRVLLRHLSELDQLIPLTRDHREIRRLNRLKRHTSALFFKLCVRRQRKK
jgi:hypothetical protein